MKKPIKCKKSLYKSTYKGNAFIKGKSYTIAKEDNLFIWVKDKENNDFNFSIKE